MSFGRRLLLEDFWGSEKAGGVAVSEVCHSIRQTSSALVQKRIQPIYTANSAKSGMQAELSKNHLKSCS